MVFQKISIFLIALFMWVEGIAQHMTPKPYNFSRFEPLIAAPVSASEGLSAHPEYGFLPVNTPCINCVEDLTRRTESKRYFTEPGRSGHFWSQSSFTPLHYRYKNSNQWLTLDYRLRPTADSGVYIADRQMVTTQLHAAAGYCAINTYDETLQFLSQASLECVDAQGITQAVYRADWSTMQVGDDGFYVRNFWPGIDLMGIFRLHEVKIQYIIHQLPSGFDPAGILRFTETVQPGKGVRLRSGLSSAESTAYRELVWEASSGQPLYGYKPLVYYDAHGRAGGHGSYRLDGDKLSYAFDKGYFQQPLNWPVIMDPVVYGVVDTGVFAAPLQNNYQFTFQPNGSCDVFLSDTVPGRSELLSTLIDLEYRTGESLCGVFPNTSSCIWTNVIQEVENVDCGTSTGALSCDTSNQTIWVGACTTDSLKVPGASAIQFQNILNCYSPQCENHILPFVLRNYETYCGSACDTLCAIGQFFRITVEACRVEATIAADKLQICAGEPVTLTATPNCGVPPYHYTWYLPSGDTTTGNPLVVYPEQTSFYQAVAYDTCAQDPWITNDVTIQVLASPPADAGPDVSLCAGGTVSLGGNPTTVNAQVQWFGPPFTNYVSWLSSPTQFNPLLTIPPGVTDTFFLVARAQNPLCFRHDTIWVYSHGLPDVRIDSLVPPVCEGQNVTLSSLNQWTSYQWSNGGTGSSLTVVPPGLYFLVAQDANGCSDTSNLVSLQSIPIPQLTVFPDTTVIYGDSVILYSSPDPLSGGIDSFFWAAAPGISCVNCPQPVVFPQEDDWYALTAFISGCQVSDSAFIRVILPNHYFFPNAFTPNGDGQNDVFYPSFQSGVNIKNFMIFNRWGEKVHDGTFPWNGTYKGLLCPPGVYVYISDVQVQDQEEALHRKGSVTLIR